MKGPSLSVSGADQLQQLPLLGRVKKAQFPVFLEAVPLQTEPTIPTTFSFQQSAADSNVRRQKLLLLQLLESAIELGSDLHSKGALSLSLSVQLLTFQQNKQSHGWVGGVHTSLVQIAEVQTVILKVIMHCEGCAGSVKRAVKRIPGVISYTIDFPAQKVTVTGAVQPNDVFKRVSKSGKLTSFWPEEPKQELKDEKTQDKKEEKAEENPQEKKEEKAAADEEKKETPEEKKEEKKAEEEEAPKAEEEEAPKAEENKEKAKEDPKAEEKKEEKEEAKLGEEKTEGTKEETKSKEEKKEEEAKEEKKEEEAPKAEGEKQEKKEEEPKAQEKVEAKKPEEPKEDLYPVTFALGPDYTRYFYY
ncbi:unnamed protein product [Sphagnum balticum]